MPEEDLEWMLPETSNIPFENMNWFSGVHVTGFVCLKRDGLEIEFIVARYESDSVFDDATSRSEAQTIAVPLDELENVALSKGWLEPKLELQTRGLKPLDQIPGSNHGRIALSIAEKDKKRVQELISGVELLKSQRALDAAKNKLPEG